MSSSNTGITIGLDVGGTAVKAAALNATNETLLQFDIPSLAKVAGPSAVREALGDSVRRFKQEGIEFDGIGIGCAGSVDHDKGIVRNSPNFQGWEDIPLRRWIEEDHKKPTIIENDANCAVYAEWKLGKANSTANNVILLTLGTGIGGGLVLNNQIYRGSTGTAGEIGHFSIHVNGIECPCGNHGCFERYCSASALEERLPDHTAKEIFDRAKRAPFYAVVEDFLHDLQIGLTSIANLFDPDVIILGGALSRGLPPYMEQMQQWLAKTAFPAVRKNTRLAFTEYENWSGAMGAAVLARA